MRRRWPAATLVLVFYVFSAVLLWTGNPMKKLVVNIHAELEVPDDWELARHPSGISVLKIGDTFVDFDLTPLATTSDDPDAEWSDENVDIVGKVLDTVTGLDADLEFISRH